jgi:SAM-dependent methyltransferase
MHPEVRSHFAMLCRRHGVGEAILEVGATSDSDTLLMLPELSGVARKVGLNMQPQHLLPGVEMVTGNANAMDFGDAAFDAVLCNSTLEHDRRFWLSLGEMRRVLKPGGLMLIGVPGYSESRASRRRPSRFLARVWREPLPGAGRLAELAVSTPTLQVHHFPADYYRFGVDAMRDVFFEGMDVLSIDEVMMPPRLIGVARR